MAPAIAFIHGIPEIGGAERELLTILDRLQRDTYLPRVICPGQGPFVEALRQRGIKTSEAEFPPWRKWYAYPRRPAAVRQLRDLIAAHPCSLIHVNDIWWVPQTRRAAKRLGVPIVAHVRQEIEPAKVSRYELERVDLAIAISEQVRRSLEMGGLRPDHVRVVYSGIDCSTLSPDHSGQQVRARLGIPADALVLGTVANLFSRKGYHVALQALPKILTSVQHAHYLVVGKGDAEYESRLQSLARQLNVTDRVHFVGFQSSVAPYLAAMDLYVHPALMEGFGIAVLEAMAMARAVVATRTGGTPEIVVEGETGMLVPPEDPEALGVAVSALLGDAPRRTAFGRAGRRRVEERFTVKTMMERITGAYTQLLECRSPTGVIGPA